MKTYAHGYSQKEFCRLADQAGTLTELLHGDVAYPAGSRILEAGCGVGVQTLTLSRSSPDARFECMDMSEVPIHAAQQLANMTFRQGDVYHSPYLATQADGTFCYTFFKGVGNSTIYEGIKR